MDITSLAIGFLLAALATTLLFYLIYSREAKRVARLLEACHRRDDLLAARERQLLLAEEKLAFLEEKQTEMKQSFEHIALEVLSEKRADQRKQEQEDLKLLLEPFSEHIKSFQERVETLYMQENRERFSLAREIQSLKSLNERISQDAINLTNALKGDNKTQGNWGEMILQKVLETSGLTEGREYEAQKGYRDGEGRVLKPDIVVHLPHDKDIVIDSKVSLKAYESYINARSDDERQRHLKAHLDSLYLHINQLSRKRYEDLEGIRTLDFVLLFIPIEAAFMTALDADRDLYEKAYRQNIILVSPTTLLAVLRTIEHAWRYEYQNSNAQKIAKKAGDLYEKFALFMESMQEIDDALKKASSAYERAHKRLSSGKGNLIARAEELKRMEGIAQTKRKLPRP